MKTVQRIAKNAGLLLGSQVISYLLAFFYIMYTVRYLGAKGFGVLSFAFAFSEIFSILADFGLAPLTIREVARDRSLASKYLANITAMKFIMAAVTFGLIALVVNLLGYPLETVNVVYLVGLSVIFRAFTRVLDSIFQAFERMEYVSLGRIIRGTLLLVSAICVIKSGLGILSFAFFYSLSGFVTMLCGLIILRWKFACPELGLPTKIIEVDWSFWKTTIKGALPFFFSAVFSIIAFRIDIVMLSMMKGDVAVGWYSAAYRVAEVLMFIPATFVTSVYPVLSNYHVSSQESLRAAYQKSFKYLSLIGLPIAVGTTLLADKIILIIYHSAFTGSVIALQFLVWTVPFIFLTYMFGTTLAAINRQRLILWILLSCMLLNIIMNLTLIPRYSYVGASVATVMTEALSFVLCYRFLSKLVCRVSIFKSIARPAISSVIMGSIIQYYTNMNVFALLCISIMIYFSCLFLLKAFSAEDFDLFKRMFNLKKVKAKE